MCWCSVGVLVFRPVHVHPHPPLHPVLHPAVLHQRAAVQPPHQGGHLPPGHHGALPSVLGMQVHRNIVFSNIQHQSREKSLVVSLLKKKQEKVARKKSSSEYNLDVIKTSEQPRAPLCGAESNLSMSSHHNRDKSDSSQSMSVVQGMMRRYDFVTIQSRI